MTERLEFVIIVLVSIGGWWLCEFYNAPRFWKSDLELWWHYHNLEPKPFFCGGWVTTGRSRQSFPCSF